MRPGISGSKTGVHINVKPFSGWLALALLAASAVLFSASFPNEIVRWGAWPLAFVALAPLFLVVNRAKPLHLLAYGFLYGALSYGLFNYWLGGYHPLTLFIVLPIYGLFGMIALPLLRLVGKALPEAGWLPQAILWVALEYLKTLGFLGYPYGILGYTQYLVPWAIQSAAVFGVWGSSLMVILPSTIIAWFWPREAWGQPPRLRFPALSKPLIAAGATWIGLSLIVLGAGAISQTDFATAKTLRISLIQHNIDPWLGGTPAYRRNLTALEDLSTKALADKPALVAWSETAFVPAIAYHRRYHEDLERLDLVNELLDFTRKTGLPFLIGTDDGERVAGSLNRVDYNATVLLQNGEPVQVYRKVKLVPFSESFPFKDSLPAIYQWLIDNRTTFWEAGTERTIFTGPDGTKFATPICFEDSFGWLSREFVNAGADLLLNVTNDSWSGSESAARQHLAMAAFRTTETGRTMVRATNGGLTALITPDGQIRQSLPALAPGYLTVDAPVVSGRTTIYLQYGDWFGQAVGIGGLGLLLTAILRLTARQRTPNIEVKDE